MYLLPDAVSFLKRGPGVSGQIGTSESNKPDDFSTRDAARFLGITEGALRKRLHDGKKKIQERIVRMAEKSFQVYRLPPDFAKRCICGCRRSEAAKTGKEVA
ncbi:MAG: hypothetical protein M0T69_07050 [Deltaproteobacteria bacterium]|nr:hypothetical protein [Deltaproteobacteria bacterium]